MGLNRLEKNPSGRPGALGTMSGIGGLPPEQVNGPRCPAAQLTDLGVRLASYQNRIVIRQKDHFSLWPADTKDTIIPGGLGWTRAER